MGVSVQEKSVRAMLRPLHRRVAATLPFRTRRMYLYLASVRRIPRVAEPLTFTEKMNWRILNDRRSALAARCDKLRMKELARGIVPSAAELHIPETYWAGTDLSQVPAEMWERPWVLKPNHSSGRVIFHDDPRPREEIIREASTWLEEDLASQLGEWGYANARKVLILEERIPGPTVPPDHKVYLFDGRIRMIQVDVDRFGEGTRTLYDEDWQPVDVTWGFPLGEPTPAPAGIDRLLDVARRLGAGWDHMRVDLYLCGDEVWFGEFSPYSQGGMMRFEPRAMDRVIGDWWRLPALAAPERA